MSAVVARINPDYVKALSICLREPERRVRVILRANRRFLGRLERRRNRSQSDASLKRHAAHIHIPRAKQFQQLHREDGRSRVIAAFHFGDFIYGLNYLMCLEPPSRNRYVLRLQAGTAEYFSNIRRAFGPAAMDAGNQLLVRETSAARLGDFLRSRATTLVTFCDLPAGFGARAAVNFHGRRAFFTRGAATLAVRNRVPILPVICCSRRLSTVVHIGRQLEPVTRLDESTQQLIQRLTQTLASTLEHYVRLDPCQWRYLRLLPTFVNREKSEEKVEGKGRRYAHGLEESASAGSMD